MQLEPHARGIPFEAEKPLHIKYKGQSLHQNYYADRLCFGQIIVDLKTLNWLSAREVAQRLNYLKATGLRVGLLFNCGSRGKLEGRRLVI